jgi:hypothetical protein
MILIFALLEKRDLMDLAKPDAEKALDYQMRPFLVGDYRKVSLGNRGG